MDAYWYVFNPHNSKCPRYKHITEQSAIIEAKRLAQENKGQRFEVLKFLGCAFVEPTPDCFKPVTNHFPEEIPF